MQAFRRISESLARRTTRRGLFSRGAGVATGMLLGAAAGTLLRPEAASAGGGTVCSFPGPPCPCPGCNASTGACAKPCHFITDFYQSGCWVLQGVTCCDCRCAELPGRGWCGCGTDYHTTYCP